MKKAALFLVLLAGVLAVAFKAREPSPYLQFVRGIPPPHPYPTTFVLLLILFMSAQWLAVFAVLRPSSYRRSWGRAAIALVISVGFFVFGALGAMHQDPFYFYYLYWLLFIIASMLLLAIWSGIASARSGHGT
jgi:cobalamin biosynthesis protein CobD/CbiB